MAIIQVLTAEPAIHNRMADYYYDRPVDFIEDNILGPAQRSMPGIDLTHHQKDLLNAIAKYPRVAVESGHGTGKSTGMAFAGLWFLATRHDVTGPLTKIPVIAPTFHQLYDIIWPEFRRWIPLSRLNEYYEVRADEAYVKGYKDTSFIRARSPKEPDNVQGFHAAHLLWLCDEAFGITDELVWETIEGSLTEGDNRIIIAGQHTVMVGYCHDAFNRDKENWTCLRFDSTESPLAKPEYADRIARKYGKDSPIYRVRVKGMDPGDNPDSFISIADVQAAQNRVVPIEGRFQMGVDCARFGDDLTVATAAIGNHIFPQVFKAKTATDDIVDLVLQEVRRIRRTHNISQTCYIKVDATGGYGAGTIDALVKNTEDDIVVVPVNFSEAGDDEYHDKISVMWGEIKSQLPYLHLPDCDFLYEELVTRSYKLDSKSRVQIEPKKEYKKDHESSPDRSDSLALCLTSKAPVQRVLKHYVSTNPKFRRNFKIEFDKTTPQDAYVYGVFIRGKDTSISGNWFFWGRKSRVLRVYAEWIHPTPIVEYTIAHALSLVRVPMLKKQNELCIEKVWGNDEMFKDGKNLAKLMRQRQINIKQNMGYNEPAAIARLNSMFSEGSIIVHYTDCPETDRQYRTWRIENRMPVKGYPLCEALCILVSELKAAGELDEPPMLPAYSRKKYNLRESLKKGQFGDLPITERKPEDWMAA